MDMVCHEPHIYNIYRKSLYINIYIYIVDDGVL